MKSKFPRCSKTLLDALHLTKIPSDFIQRSVPVPHKEDEAAEMQLQLTKLRDEMKRRDTNHRAVRGAYITTMTGSRARIRGGQRFLCEETKIRGIPVKNTPLRKKMGHLGGGILKYCFGYKPQNFSPAAGNLK